MKSSVRAPQTASADRRLTLINTLHRRILTLQLLPGAALNEQALCDEFGLSRSTVRAGLQQLAADGYLDLHTNRSATVKGLSEPAVPDFLQAAALIYSATSQLAALRATLADTGHLRRIKADLERAMHRCEVDRCLMLDHQLHQAIGRITHDPYLAPSQGHLLIDHARLCKRLYAHSPSEYSQQAFKGDCEHYGSLINAIEHNEAERAAGVVSGYMKTLRQRLSQAASPEHNKSPLRYPASALPTGISGLGIGALTPHRRCLSGVYV